MRWTKKARKIPRHGERRTRKFFALFPVTINREVRWLEIVDITEEFFVSNISLRSWWYPHHFNN